MTVGQVLTSYDLLNTPTRVNLPFHICVIPTSVRRRHYAFYIFLFASVTAIERVNLHTKQFAWEFRERMNKMYNDSGNSEYIFDMIALQPFANDFVLSMNEDDDV